MSPSEPTPANPPSRRRRAVRWLKIVLIPPAVLYLLVIVMLAAFQDSLIFPGKESQGRPEAAIRPPKGCDLVALQAQNGERVVALFGPALDRVGRPLADAASRPTLLYFYGNGEALAHELPLFAEYRRHGLNVMIPDYLGYGLSGGKAGEAGCLAAADACYEHLLTRADVDPSRVVVGGWSLGGAVAIDLASRRPVAGLMVFSTFTTMTDLVRHLYPFAPTALLNHKFASLEKVGRVRAPILIGHGRRDDIVPFAMAARLAAAAKAPVTSFTIEGAGHNDFYGVGADALDGEVAKFLAALGQNTPPGEP